MRAALLSARLWLTRRSKMRRIMVQPKMFTIDARAPRRRYAMLRFAADMLRAAYMFESA